MDDKRSVLVVDDVEQNRRAVKTFLFFCHFEATLASDGLEARKILESRSFDLVVSDIEMPNMNGFELLASIRKSPAHGKTPVIMLSTLDTPEVQERCKRLGANSYIVKPFTKEKFDAALKAIGLIP